MALLSSPKGAGLKNTLASSESLVTSGRQLFSVSLGIDLTCVTVIYSFMLQSL